MQGSFFRGQFLVSIILGYIHYFVVFFLIGIEYSILRSFRWTSFSLIPEKKLIFIILFILATYINTICIFIRSWIYFHNNSNIFSSIFIRRIFFISQNNIDKL